jgi:Tfp pilus assembly protein PilO
MTRSRIWTLGTAAVVVVVLLAGWFLLVAPTRADAAAVQQQTVDQQAANVQLASKIEQLKVQAQDLPAQEAKLAKFRQKIPAQPALPSFIRTLSSISGDTDVVLVSMEPTVPATLPGAPVTATAPTTTDGSTPAATDGSTPPAGNSASDIQYIQVQVTIRGGYFNTERFLTKLEGLKRAFLVTGFDLAPDKNPEATTGDVETHMQLRVFYSPTTADSGAAAATTTATN